MKYIICDLDGTLCDCSERRQFMEQEPKDWKNFYYGIPYDKCNQWCKEILRRFYRDYHIVLMSGRPDNYKTETIQWLKDNFINYHTLLMRKEGDHRKDSIVKLELFGKIRESGEILFSIDDRQQVVDMWRAEGVTCLQCDYGNF